MVRTDETCGKQRDTNHTGCKWKYSMCMSMCDIAKSIKRLLFVSL